MIREFEASELLSTILIKRNEAYHYKRGGRLGFNRIFTISNRVMEQNPSIRIRVSVTSIKSFCSYLAIECKNDEIIIKKLDDNTIAKLRQYKPIEDDVVQAFINANY